MSDCGDCDCDCGDCCCDESCCGCLGDICECCCQCCEICCYIDDDCIFCYFLYRLCCPDERSNRNCCCCCCCENNRTNLDTNPEQLEAVTQQPKLLTNQEKPLDNFRMKEFDRSVTNQPSGSLNDGPIQASQDATTDKNQDFGANVNRPIIVQKPITPPPSYEKIAFDLKKENGGYREVPEK